MNYPLDINVDGNAFAKLGLADLAEPNYGRTSLVNAPNSITWRYLAIKEVGTNRGAALTKSSTTNNRLTAHNGNKSLS